MNSPTTAEGRLVLHPALPSDAVLPEHLRGSREAIFHLLRRDPGPNGPVRPRPATLPAAILTRPACAPKQAPASSVRNAGWQGFLQEDQFEFLSMETRSAAVRSYASSGNRMAAS